jgi:hypothetical protein
MDIGERDSPKSPSIEVLWCGDLSMPVIEKLASGSNVVIRGRRGVPPGMCLARCHGARKD